MSNSNLTNKNAKEFWNNRYETAQTGWDLGEVSPPLKGYIDQLENKNLRILIPGCGNTYEAEYLLRQGFSDVTVIDIAPLLVKKLKEKFQGNSHIRIIEGDFFKLDETYDLILEQTFFCALDPSLRTSYADKMKSLLNPGGKLVGVFFDKNFEQPGPPFGGTKTEYRKLFESDFELKIFKSCFNSYTKRAGSELFAVLLKK